MKILRSLFAVTSVLIFLTISCTKKDNGTKAEEADKSDAYIPVKTQTLEQKPYKSYSEYLGTVYGLEQATLIAYGGGRVQSLSGLEGQKVSKGKSLCSIEGSKFLNNYKSAALQEKIAKQELARKKVHLKRGSASRLQVDQAESEYLGAKSRTIEANRNKEGALCQSPINGTVVERLIDSYEVLNPGQPTFIIADMEKVKIRIGVPENEINGFQEGRGAFIHIANQPEKDKTGSVTRITKNINASTKTFTVDVVVDNKEQSLFPGHTVRVSLLRYDLKDQIVIPTSSILTVGKDQFVYTIKDNKSYRRKISVFTQDTKNAVVQKGLSLGEVIITSGHLRAGDGAQVKIIENK